MELKHVDAQFSKYFKSSQVLSGALNPKVCRSKNHELRLKMEAWTKRQGERDRQRERLFQKSKEIRQKFDDYLGYFEITPEIIQEYRLKYDELIGNLKVMAKEERHLVDLLVKLQTGPALLSLRDLERILDSETMSFKQKVNIQEKIIH